MREMKDSGVEWIGKIPKDWSLNKIGSIYEERLIKVSDKDYPPLSVTKNGIVPQLETAAKTDNGDNRKLIRKNDFVINSRSDRRGSCGISEYEGSCSLINTVLKPRTNMNNAYYSFVFRSEQFADEFYRWGTGIVNDLWSTKWSNMKNIYIPFPSLDEQQSIASYLESKCSKIDIIIEKQQTVIEKLKEYKLSLITEAVTKGLNLDVPMKYSGNKFISTIPYDWDICRMKNLYPKCKDPIKVGPFGSELKAKDYTTDGYWVYNQRVVLDNNFDINDTFISREKFKSLKGFAVEEGDVLVTTRGTGTTGQIARVPKKYHEGVLHPCVMKFKLDEKKCLYKFLFYIFKYSAYMRGEIDIANNTSSLPVLYSYTLNNLYIAVPSICEQKNVVDYLDLKCSAIDATISKKQALIEKLTAYKKSLIYEVVTGKKEV